MLACGTYSELQGSGIDFTSLLKEEEGQEERQSTTPISVSRYPHTLSDNSMSSMSSLSSSRYSLIDGTEPLAVVGTCETFKHAFIVISLWVKACCAFHQPLEGRRYSPFPCHSLQPDLLDDWHLL